MVEDDWDGTTIESWMRKMIAEGYPEIVADLLRVLPEDSKKKYRLIWKELMDQKKKEEL